MNFRPLALAISLTTLGTSTVYSSVQQEPITPIDKLVKEAFSATSTATAKHAIDSVIPNLTNNIDQILIDHFKNAGIDHPENIIVTVGILQETDIAVPSNTALLTTNTLRGQTRPTTFQWTRMPLLKLAKMRAFGSSAPANRSYLAGAHRIGQPTFPLPTGGHDSVLLDSEGNRMAGHADWPDRLTIEQAVKGTMNIKMEDHSLIDFSKIQWKQRHREKTYPPIISETGGEYRTIEISATVEDERQRALNGNGKIVDDPVDFSAWHIDYPSILFSDEATNAFRRVAEGKEVDISDWAYMITAQTRAETTTTVAQHFANQLLLSAQLAYRAVDVNPEAGELSLNELSTVERLVNGDNNVAAFIPHLPAKGYVPFNLNGVKNTGHIPTIISKHHALIVDENAGVYLWHFAHGPKQGLRGGFTSQEEAITWYRNWLTHKGGRTSPQDKGEVYSYYNQSFEDHLVLDESGWWLLKKKYNYDLSHWRSEKAEQLKLLPIGEKTYGRALADQFFKAKHADIDSQYKQRSEQYAEDLRYWYDFAATMAAILGVTVSGSASSALDLATIAGGVYVGVVTIHNADHPNEVFEGVSAIIEATADTMQATGIGSRLGRKRSSINNIVHGASTVIRDRLVQGTIGQSGAKSASFMLTRKASTDLQSELSQIWNAPQPETVQNTKKLNITQNDKQLDVVLYQGKAYARFPNGYWFDFKLDLSALQLTDINTISEADRALQVTQKEIEEQLQAVDKTTFDQDKGYSITTIKEFENSNKVTSRVTFSPQKWNIGNIARSKGVPFHISDLIRIQYQAVSKYFGFNGELPSVIRISDIEENKTSMLVHKLSSNKITQEEFVSRFMETSPFRHMVNNILNDFNLKVDSISGGIEKKGSFSKLPHIDISVSSKGFKGTGNNFLELLSSRVAKFKSRSQKQRGYPLQFQKIPKKGVATVSYIEEGNVLEVQIEINKKRPLTEQLLDKFAPISDGSQYGSPGVDYTGKKNLYDITKIRISSSSDDSGKTVYYPKSKIGKYKYANILYDGVPVDANNINHIITPDTFDQYTEGSNGFKYTVHDGLYVIQQGTTSSCGYTALTMTLMDVGIDASRLYYHINKEDSGLYTSELFELAKKLTDNVTMEYTQNVVESLKENLAPMGDQRTAIIARDGHFVVVDNINNQTVTIRDPYQGTLSTIDSNTFFSKWVESNIIYFPAH